MFQAQSATKDCIISGLRETSIKSVIVERTNNLAELRPEEHSEKEECCRENLWNEKQFMGPHSGRNGHKNRIKGNGHIPTA